MKYNNIFSSASQNYLLCCQETVTQVEERFASVWSDWLLARCWIQTCHDSVIVSWCNTGLRGRYQNTNGRVEGVIWPLSLIIAG